MAQSQASSTTPKLIMAGCICVVIAALYFAQEVLIPLALATLLSFLLAPLVKRLEHLKLPRAAAVIVTVLVAFGALFGIGWVVYNQVGDLKADMGSYHDRIINKISSIQHGGVVNWFHSANEEVNKVLHSSAAQPAKTEQTPQVAPMGYTPPSSGSPFDLLKPIYSFLLGPLGTAFIVTVFAIFMLLQREDLRDRLIRLMGRNRLTLTTQALDDAAERVSRYLLMQSLVNSSVGVIIFSLLWGVGRMNHGVFPAVALWGLMATLLRFIPYVGIWISSVTPILIALAVFNAKAAIETLFCYGGVEIITANAIEPMLFGSSTGIATLAVLVAAAFWTWLWGPVGLLLSTPLTVCLVVMGKYVPQLEFLTILLAEEPALSPPDRVYQRLLATDQEEAEDLVEGYAKSMPLEEVYDTVLIPALATAEVDAHRGRLGDEHLVRIQKGIRDILDDLRRTQKAKDAKEINSTPDVNAETRTMLPKGCTANVICLPANAESDEIAGLMLAHLLELRGYCVKVASIAQLASEMVQTVSDFKADVVCVSALPPAGVTHARYLCKRMHGNLPDIQMVVGLWANEGDPKRAMDRISTVRPVRMANTLVKAIDEIHQLAQQPKILGSTEKETPATVGTVPNT